MIVIIHAMQNKEILLASRPTGVPTDTNFKFVDTEVPSLNDNQVLIRMMYISVDPYLRGRMRESKSYIAPFEVGKAIESAGVGEVVESRSPNFKTGDIVRGQFGWRMYNVADAKHLMGVVPGVAPSASLGVLGVTGLTAYFGLLDIGKPKDGETLVVSGAAERSESLRARSERLRAVG